MMLRATARPSPDPSMSTPFVRLVSGITVNQGRVEVIYRKEIGTICDDGWDDRDAEVICSMLGFQRSGSRAIGGATYTPGSGRIWLTNVNCVGNEASIEDCLTSNEWGVDDNCDHSEDAAVMCSTCSPLNNFILMTDTDNEAIYRMDLSTYSYTQIHQVYINEPISIGYDHVDEKIYWSDKRSRRLYRAQLDGLNRYSILRFISTSSAAAEIAVDPISRNLYFTHPDSGSIYVVSLNGYAFKAMFNAGDKPRGIAVHPSKGYIFWTDVWSLSPKIERANTDGTARRTLITTGIRSPNSLAIDYKANYLYWADSGEGKIEKCDFNGNKRLVIIRESGSVYGLVIVQNHIYYTDSDERNVLRMDKNGRNRKTVGPTVFDQLTSITAYKSNDGIASLSPNRCTSNKGGCSHICIPMPNGAFKCICPRDMTQRSVSGPCIANVPTTQPAPTTPVPKPDPANGIVHLVRSRTGTQGRVEVIYNNQLGTVCHDFWGDEEAGVVCSMLGYQRSGSRAVGSGLYGPGSGRISLDDVNCVGDESSLAECPTRNGWLVHDCNHTNDAGVMCHSCTPLDNFLLLTDKDNKRVYRMDLTTFSYADHGYIPTGRPVLMAYDSVKQDVYWVDDVFHVIVRLDIDATQLSVLANLPNTSIPVGLTIDPISRNLFYIDAALKLIIIIPLDGKTGFYTYSGSAFVKPGGIAVHPTRGYIFWTEQTRGAAGILRLNMDATNGIRLVSTRLGQPLSITIDYAADRILWVDALLDKIEKCDFEGRNRVTIYEGGQLNSLSVLEGFVYFTDSTVRHIRKIDVNGNRSATAVGPSVFGHLNAVFAYKANHGINSLGANGCSRARGGCDHICLPLPAGSIICRCHSRKKLQSDGKTCR